MLSESDISRYPYLVPRLRKKPLGLSLSWTVSAVSFFVDYCQVEDATFSYYFSVFFFKINDWMLSFIKSFLPHFYIFLLDPINNIMNYVT